MVFPLKKLREQRGITQAELSKMLNIAPSTVGMWEQGRREPDYENLKRIAGIFNVSTDYLLDYEGNKNVPLSNEQVDLLSGFDKLNRVNQKMIKKLVDTFLRAQSSEMAV